MKNQGVGNMRNYTWLVALALVIGTRAEAGVEKAGTTAANFLSVGSGAGILGMGGATLGAGGDLSMINWNVAALGSLNETQYVISHAGLSANSSQEWAAVGGRFRHSATRWSLSGLYQGEGAFEGRDATGVSTGTFNVSSMAFAGHLAQAFGDYVTLGFGAKFVSENLGTATGWGGTYDAGIQVRNGTFGFGLAAQNIGGRMMYGNAIYPVPTNIGAGFAYQIPASGLRFALDANFPSAYYSDVRAGVEWMYKERLALRTGYRKEMGGASDDALTGPTFGMGAGLRGMWFDYGYLVGGGAGEGQHRLGLSFHPGALNWSGGQDLGMTPNAGGQPPAAKPTVRTNEGASSAAPRAETPKASSGTTSNTPASAPASMPAPATAAPTATPRAITPAAAPTAGTPAPTTAAPKAISPATVAPTATPKAIMPATLAPTATPKAITPPVTSSSTAPAMPSSPAAKSTPDVAAPSVAQKAVTTDDSRPEATKSAVSVAPALKIEAPKPTVTQAPVVVAPKAETPKIETPKAEAPKSTLVPAPVVTAPKAETPKIETPKVEAPKSTVAQAPPVAAPKTVTPKPAVAAIAPPAEAPKAVTPSASEPAPVPLAQRPATVKVRKGDTLASIGRTYGLTYEAIMMENNMVRQDIKPGQTLKLPKK
jgi:LysM repeat protein